MKTKPLIYIGLLSTFLVLTGRYIIKSDSTQIIENPLATTDNSDTTRLSMDDRKHYVLDKTIENKVTAISDSICSQLMKISFKNWRTSELQDINSEILENCLTPLVTSPSPDITSITNLVLIWSDLDLIQALDFVFILPTPIDSYVMPAIIEQGIASNPEALHDWLIASGLFDKFETQEAYYRGMAKLEPENALYEILTISSDSDENKLRQRRLIAAVLEEWSKIDAEKALNWLQQLKSNGNKEIQTTDDLEISLLFNLIAQNDQLAEEKILSLASSPKKTRLLQYFVKFMSELDPQLAMEWAQSISESSSKHIVMSSAVQYWARGETSSKDIVDFILAEPDKALRNTLMEEAAISLGDRSSPELASIFDQFPEEHQPTIVDTLTRSWINKDYSAASEWVAKLSNGLPRDIAIKNMVSLGLQNFKDVSLAVTMAQTIEDSALRYEASKDILLSVASDDPQKAQSIVAEMGKLSEEELGYLTTLISNK